MRIAVIGAGIVGVSCALHLRGDGHDVTLIDPRAPGTSTSFGNAGGIGTGAVVPNSTPALWRDIPRMLFDRDSAVRVSWRYLPRLAPWLIRFLLAGRHERVQAIYDREIMQARGVRLDVLGPDEVRQLEPSLARRYVKGLFQPDSAFVTSPHKLVQAHAAHFQSLGGNLAQERVRGVQPSDGGVTSGLRARHSRLRCGGPGADAGRHPPDQRRRTGGPECAARILAHPPPSAGGPRGTAGTVRPRSRASGWAIGHQRPTRCRSSADHRVAVRCSMPSAISISV